MAVQSQCRLLLASHLGHSLRITENVAVHQQKRLPSYHLPCQPEREDIIVVLVIGVVDKLKIEN